MPAQQGHVRSAIDWWCAHVLRDACAACTAVTRLAGLCGGGVRGVYDFVTTPSEPLSAGRSAATFLNKRTRAEKVAGRPVQPVASAKNEESRRPLDHLRARVQAGLKTDEVVVPLWETDPLLLQASAAAARRCRGAAGG